mgnify:CR=1 FL=1
MSPVWLGILLIYIFSSQLGWLPAMGYGGIKFVILPAITLGYPVAAEITRIGRSGMIDVLKEDYITATYAKGMSRREVLWKYAFKNALIPIITLVGVQIGVFLAGTVVVETIFSWSGLGQLVNQAVSTRDYQLVQSSLLIIAAMFAIINLLGATAMAGAVGAGGLGAVALTYGYQNFNQEIMYSICVVLIVLVAAIQYFGDWIYKKLK